MSNDIQQKTIDLGEMMNKDTATISRWVTTSQST